MNSETLAISPDGRYQVQTTPWEAGPSHWVFPPEIIDTLPAICVFAFTDRRWSADHALWVGPAQVQLTLRKYPGQQTGTGWLITFDLARGVAGYGAGVEVSLAGLEVALEELSHH